MNSYIKQVYRTYSQYGIKILLQRIVNFAIFKVKRITMPKDIKNYELLEMVQVSIKCRSIC